MQEPSEESNESPGGDPDDRSSMDPYNRILRGEEAAIDWFVRKHEKEILAIVRFKLRDSWLRDLEESRDLLQSVLKVLLERSGRGRVDSVKDLDEFWRRIKCTVQRRRIDHMRRFRTKKRPPLKFDFEAVARTPDEAAMDPAEVAALRDECNRASGLLTPRERVLCHLRIIEGLSWDLIAERMGEEKTADAYGKEFKRLCQRIQDQNGDRGD
jgi:DNA-directed RNA polymerase specialized sigma24 family protein